MKNQFNLKSLISALISTMVLMFASLSAQAVDCSDLSASRCKSSDSCSYKTR